MKAILFDLDGTLLDRQATLRQFVVAQHQRLASALGHIPAEHYLSRFMELDCHGHVWKDEVYQCLVDEFKITGLGWPALLEDFELQFARRCVPFPNLFPMLDALQERGYRLGLITNGPGAFQMRSIRGLGVERYFDAILISEVEGVRKPDLDIFQRALARLGANTEAAVFVGDHPEADIAGAKRAGLKTIWKKDEYWQIAPEANATVEDLADIPSIVEGFGLEQEEAVLG